MNKCPCKDCLCKPMCQNKYYYDLFEECSLVNEFLPYPGSLENRSHTDIKSLALELQSATWHYEMRSIADVDPYKKIPYIILDKKKKKKGT